MILVELQLKPTDLKAQLTEGKVMAIKANTAATKLVAKAVKAEAARAVVDYKQSADFRDGVGKVA